MKTIKLIVRLNNVMELEIGYSVIESLNVFCLAESKGYHFESKIDKSRDKCILIIISLKRKDPPWIELKWKMTWSEMVTLLNWKWWSNDFIFSIVVLRSFGVVGTKCKYHYLNDINDNNNKSLTLCAIHFGQRVSIDITSHITT